MYRYTIAFALRDGAMCATAFADSGDTAPARLPNAAQSAALVYNVGCALGNRTLAVSLGGVVVWNSTREMARGEPYEFAAATYTYQPLLKQPGQESRPSTVKPSYNFKERNIYRFYFGRLGSDAAPAQALELMAGPDVALLADLPLDATGEASDDDLSFLEKLEKWIIGIISIIAFD